MGNKQTGMMSKEAAKFIFDSAYHYRAPIDSEGNMLPKAFETLAYYEEQLAKEKQQSAELQTADEKTIQKKADAWYEQEKAYKDENYQQYREEKARLESLLEEVLVWSAPTEQHEPLKKRCIDALRRAIDHAQSHMDHYHPENLTRPSAHEWYEREVKDIERRMAFTEEQCQKFLANKEEVLVWVEQLKSSLR